MLASLGVIASWSIGGLYLALAPSLAGKLFDTHRARADFRIFGSIVVALALVTALGTRHRAIAA